jgi:uncharacterized membrane-anchored protein YjiN (DUF445 family)
MFYGARRDPRPTSGRAEVILSSSEARRARQLQVTRRQATGLLGVVAAVFVCATVFIGREHWLSWVQATAVASLVGGLADWFAVTALFRRPLGLPIPHTAIIVERKDRFGETLGSFVQESFLSPDAVVARLRGAEAVPRAARWLADLDHADMMATRAARLVVEGAELLNDDDVHDLLVTLAKERLDHIALAPLAGRGLEQAIRDNRHQPVLDSALSALAHYLDEHGTELHARLGAQSPWWLPGPIEGRVVNRLVERSQHVLADMAADRDHPLRRQLDGAMAKLAADLQTSPEVRARGEELKAELLGQPQLRGFAATLWEDTKVRLRAEATDPSSRLHTHLASAIAQTGARLRDEPELAASAERGVETVARAVLGRFQGELAGLVSGTITRWDGTETSRRLELLLGPDLQYIRINGTVVGALAGLALHGLSQTL